MPVLLAALGLLLTGPVKAQPFTTIHSFTALSYSGMNSDGAYPRAGLVLAGNNLYGTANGGGNFFHFSLAPPMAYSNWVAIDHQAI